MLPARYEEHIMDEKKRRQLEQAGWKVGSAEEFLELSPEEADYIELKLALSTSLRQVRTSKKMTQAELASLLKSSQSRVAKMEAGDPTVSLDLLVRSLLSLGVTRESLSQLIAA
jgi:predicted XRE-type DNA-binding protein